MPNPIWAGASFGMMVKHAAIDVGGLRKIALGLQRAREREQRVRMRGRQRDRARKGGMRVYVLAQRRVNAAELQRQVGEIGRNRETLLQDVGRLVVPAERGQKNSEFEEGRRKRRLALDRALEPFVRLLRTAGLAQRHRQPHLGRGIARLARGTLERRDRVLAAALHQQRGSEQLHRRQAAGIGLEHVGGEEFGLKRAAGLDRRGGALQGKLACARTAPGCIWKRRRLEGHRLLPVLRAKAMNLSLARPIDQDGRATGAQLPPLFAHRRLR